MAHTPPTGSRELSRLEGFSDGVFAIVITLLVLDLKVPSEEEVRAVGLARALAEQWPAYAAFLASFVQVLIMWVNHHGIFRQLARHDPLFLFANGLLLLVVTVVPFPTGLVSAYLRSPWASVACAVYAGTYVCINVGFNVLWYAATRGRRLLEPHVQESDVRRIRTRHLAPFPVYLLSVGLAFVRPWLSLALCSSLWILWVRMGRLYDTVARRPR